MPRNENQNEQTRARYEKIAAALLAGELSVKEIAEHFQVSTKTVARAREVMADQELKKTQQIKITTMARAAC